MLILSVSSDLLQLYALNVNLTKEIDKKCEEYHT